MKNLPVEAVYIAKPEFIPQLLKEVPQGQSIEDVVLGPLKQVCFALDVWSNPTIVSFASISEAAEILKAAGKFWYLHPVSNVRRSTLILQKLRKLPALSRTFPIQEPIPDIGGFFLLDANTLVFSTQRLKKWPDGKCLFIEDKINPPNRAYLKLWEALSLLPKLPETGELALDLGASPGGWTYVMHCLGAEVVAVDKAELDPKIQKLPRVTFLKQSAFAFEPTMQEKLFDYVLCDVACYPERALALIQKWIASQKAKQLIFTIKLQGETDLEILHTLQNIPNAQVLHLFNNKHEATFFYPKLTNSQ